MDEIKKHANLHERFTYLSLNFIIFIGCHICK